MKVVSFIGTKRGMSKQQKVTVKDLLLFYAPKVLVQGCCVGADAEACEMAVKLKIKCTGYFTFDEADTSETAKVLCKKEIAGPDNAYTRYMQIVDEGGVCLFCPHHPSRQTSGEVWDVLKYAKTLRKTKIIIYPDGSKEEFV